MTPDSGLPNQKVQRRLAEADASTVRGVLAELARDVATDETILDVCRAAMAEATEFVRHNDLMTVYDDQVDVIEMPETAPSANAPYASRKNDVSSAASLRPYHQRQPAQRRRCCARSHRRCGQRPSQRMLFIGH